MGFPPRLLLLLLCLLCPLSPRPQAFSPAAVSGFFDSAFLAEYGDVDRRFLIRWEGPLRVCLLGSPTPADRETLLSLLEGLKTRVPGLPPLSLTDLEEEANVLFFFVPLSRMGEAVAEYLPGNWGFMSCYHTDAVIQYARAAVASDVTSQAQRNRILQEEFVNLLGLCNDIDAPESIIYRHASDTQAPAPMDYEMLALLYHPSILPGMTAQEAREALSRKISAP